jgi:ABC-2 type transport system permease protein
VCTTLALIGVGLPTAGSVAFGLAWAGVGIAFAAVAALAAQVTRGARTATGLAVATLVVGDTASATGPAWLSWLSPIGWAQQLRPYAGDRWWLLAITIGFAILVTAAAVALAASPGRARSCWAA